MDYVIVENALSDALLQRVQQAMAQGPFDDGKATASGLAQAVKHNLQLSLAKLNTLTHHLRESQQQPLAMVANECAQNLTRMWGD